MLERDPTKRLSAEEFLEAAQSLQLESLDPYTALEKDPDSTLQNFIKDNAVDPTSVVASSVIPKDTTNEGEVKYSHKPANSVLASEISSERRRHNSVDSASMRPSSSAASSSSTMTAAGALYSAALGALGWGSTTPQKTAKVVALGASTPYKSRAHQQSQVQHNPGQTDPSAPAAVPSSASSDSSSSEDFVVIESNQSRPWRADAVGLVSVKDLDSTSVYSKESAVARPVPEPVGADCGDGCVVQNPNITTTTTASSKCSLLDANKQNDFSQVKVPTISSMSSMTDMALSEPHIATIISDCQYVCALVCEITRVGDQIVTKTVVKPAIYQNAVSIYLHALARLRDCMLRVQAIRKSINESHTAWEKLKALANVRFKFIS
jgi:hypothetical protein